VFGNTKPVLPFGGEEWTMLFDRSPVCASASQVPRTSAFRSDQSWAAAEITESTGADGSDKIEASDASVSKPSPATADKPPR